MDKKTLLNKHQPRKNNSKYPFQITSSIQVTTGCVYSRDFSEIAHQINTHYEQGGNNFLSVWANVLSHGQISIVYTRLLWTHFNRGK